jgi:hypothetical protein
MRERESSNGRNGLCRHSDKGERERERMTLFTFLDLCEGKRQKKRGAYYYYYYFCG